jgi:hypothetical protein
VTIRKVINEAGEVMRYRCRVERKEIGVINRSFRDQISAERFVNDFYRKYPSRQGDARNRGGIRIKTMVESSRLRCARDIPETMQINGCLLTRGPGRCTSMTDCPHYLERGTGCLDMAERAGWEGWTATHA